MTSPSPPFPQLLVTLFGWLGGYNGSHSFEKPGIEYDGYQGIMAMRVVSGRGDEDWGLNDIFI